MLYGPNRKCYLNTYDGKQEALCKSRANADYHIVTTLDEKYSIQVNNTIVNTRFNETEKPEFYAL